MNLFVSFSAIHSVKYRWLWFNSRLNEVNHWTNVIWPNLHIHMHRKWFAWTIFHRNWILSTMLPSLLNFRICFLYSFENFECFDFSEFHLTTDISTLDRKKYTATAKSSFADIELNSLFLSAYGHNTAYTNIIYIIISPINSRISCQRSLWSILIFRFRQQFYEAKSSTLFPNCFFFIHKYMWVFFVDSLFCCWQFFRCLN